MSDGHKPTSGMKSAAARALAWKKDGKRGGTIIGLTRANQIVNGTSLSDSTVKRMYSFFSRHEVDKRATGFSAGEEGYPSPGRVAWDLWGGDAGYSWSRKIVNQLKNKEMKKADSKFSVGDMVSWNSSGGTATGRIEHIMRDGVLGIPNTEFSIKATEEDPAVLIRIYQDGEPTETLVGHKMSTLRAANTDKGYHMKKKMKLSVGDMVSWNSSGGRATGKITRIVVSGKINVPDSDFVITGTKEDPAALIRLYRDGKPTDTYVGHKLSTLRSSSMKKNDDYEMPEDMEPSDELENLNDRQVAQYEYYEVLANDFGMFKQDTGADGAHYADGNNNPFKSEGLKCSNCVFYEEGACEIVEGTIDPEGICKLWIIPEEKLVKSMTENNIEKKDYTTAERNRMAQRGVALPDGSFPIANEQDLRNAIQSYGRAANAARAKAHIIRRARALGLTEMLPEDWKKMAKSMWAGSPFDQTGLI